MATTFRVQRRVEFRDTDMAGIVHFSVFFMYMEQAEYEFLRSLGMSVVGDVAGQTLSWPRVAAECNYRRAIKFEQMIDIELSISRIGDKSVAYAYNFFESGQPIADGSITTVCCEFEHGSRPKSITIPDVVREKLQPFITA
ncbi:MAG: thioesterase family protein [Pirellulaceae bacterium]